MATFTFEDWDSALKFAQEEQSDDFLTQVATFQELNSEQERIAMLETTNALSNDFILFLVYHEREFFNNNVRELLQGRPPNVFDLFVLHFINGKPAESILQKLLPQINALYDCYVTGATELNGFEVAALLCMRSCYTDVTDSMTVLEKNEVTIRTQQLNRKLLKLQQPEDEAVICTGAGPRFGYQVENRAVAEMDRLYHERMWYAPNYLYENVPFTAFWLEFVEVWMGGREHIELEAYLEAVVLDDIRQVRLAVACMQLPKRMSYSIEQREQREIEVSISSTLACEHPKMNGFIALTGQLQVNASDFAEAMLHVELPEGLISEDMDNCIEQDFPVVPGENIVEFDSKLCCFMQECREIKAVVVILEKEYAVSVHYEAEAIDNLLAKCTCADQLKYASLCNLQQKKAQINLFLKNKNYQSLLHDKEFADCLLVEYYELQQNNCEEFRRLELLVALIQHDEAIIQKYCNDLYVGFISEKINNLLFEPHANLLIQDNYSLPNIMENSLSPMDKQIYCKLCLKVALESITLPERHELLLLLLKQAKYQRAQEYISGCTDEKSEFISLLCDVAIGKSSEKELREFSESHADYLTKKNQEIIADLTQEFDESSKSDFSAYNKENTIYFSQSPVYLKIYKKGIYFDKLINYLPFLEMEVAEDHYTINEQGNFIVKCEYEFEEVELQIDNSKIEYTIDQAEGMLTVSGADIVNKYYCQVMHDSQFYKDGFTDYEGRFDYFTVSDKESVRGELDILIIGKDQNFVTLRASMSDEVVMEEQRGVFPIEFQPRMPPAMGDVM